ncbi:MAG: hypothetical protein NT038_05510 [Euryarchaeota archaeon]|nr:hypothetical protein [Euryarchaeota archaeon]
MNREVLPLILAILLPIVFVVVLFLYFSGYIDGIVTSLKTTDLIYYVILIPFCLGFLAVMMKWMKR